MRKLEKKPKVRTKKKKQEVILVIEFRLFFCLMHASEIPLSEHTDSIQTPPGNYELIIAL